MKTVVMGADSYGYAINENKSAGIVNCTCRHVISLFTLYNINERTLQIFVFVIK